MASGVLSPRCRIREKTVEKHELNYCNDAGTRHNRTPGIRETSLPGTAILITAAARLHMDFQAEGLYTFIRQEDVG